MKMSRDYSKKDIKILFGNSGKRCAMPDCRRLLILPDDPQRHSHTVIAEIAHIVPLDSTDKRFDPDYPKELLDSPENLIIVCPTCHTIIDKQTQYTVEDLREIKKNHLAWVDNQLSAELPNVNFPELEVVCNHMLTNFSQTDEDYRIITPQEKIRKNNLNKSYSKIVLGLARAQEVRDFLASMDSLSPTYSTKLRNGFVDQYLTLYNQGLQGDEIFFRLFEYVNNGSHDFDRQAVGLSVLTYFFEACDIFEK